MKDDLIICRCQEIKESEIRQAVAEGALSLDGVKRRTRAGMGLCQGKTCSRLLARIVAEETGMPAADVLPLTARPPVRPMSLSAFEEDGDGENI